MLAAAVGGYVKGRDTRTRWETEEEDAAYQKETRDAWRKDRAAKDAERQMLVDAAAPVEVQQEHGPPAPIVSPPSVDANGQQQPGTVTLPDMSQPISWRAGSKVFDTQEQAQSYAQQHNTPQAQTQRMLDGYRRLGMPDKAIALEASDMQAKAARMDLAQKQFRTELGQAMWRGPQGIADVANKFELGPRGAQVQAQISPDGRSFTFVAVGKDGKAQPIPGVGVYDNNEMGHGLAAFQLDGYVTPEQRLNYYTGRLDKEREQARQDREFAYKLYHDDRQFGLLQNRDVRETAETGLRLRKGEVELQQALNSDRLPAATKMQLEGIQKDLESVNAQINKALGEGMVDMQSPHYKELERRRDLLVAQRRALWNQADGGDSRDVLGVRGSPDVKLGDRQLDYVQRYGGMAQQISQRLGGVPPSVLLAQFALETGWGKHVIPGTNNHGNIKDFRGGGVAATDNMTGSRDKYRVYADDAAFAADYASLIERRYPGAVGAKDAESYVRALHQGGYAEDPNYVRKVLALARQIEAAQAQASAPKQAEARGAPGSSEQAVPAQAVAAQAGAGPAQAPASTQTKAPVSMAADVGAGGQSARDVPPAQGGIERVTPQAMAKWKLDTARLQAREAQAALRRFDPRQQRDDPQGFARAQARLAQAKEAARQALAAYEKTLPEQAKRASVADRQGA